MALEVCAGSWDLRRCLASAALASGRVNVFSLEGKGNRCFSFCEGAWRAELPEAAPEACGEAGDTLQGSQVPVFCPDCDIWDEGWYL